MANFLSKLVKKLGNYKIRKGTEYAFRCPFCADHKQRMEINLKINWWYCYRCGRKGRAKELLPNYIKDRAKWYTPIPVDNLFDNSVYDKFKLDDPNPCMIFKMPEPLQIPEHLHRFRDDKRFVTNEILKFLIARKVPTVAAVEKGWGIVLQPKFRNRIFIPIMENGLLVSWVARAINSQEPKELAPPNAPRSRFLYNVDSINSGDRVFLVEGILDCEVLEANKLKAAAVMGSHISDVQIGKLLSKKPEHITILFDGDTAGYEGGFEAYMKIASRQGLINVTRLILPEGKDPDDLKMGDFKSLLKGEYESAQL